MTKRAAFIDKNNELIQEFNFAHPKTKMEMNRIFNNHFTGSPTWDLFCKESEMLYNSWNRSVRMMCDLPLQTHRYFLEPLAQTRQLKFVLMKRFLSFIHQIETSQKTLPKLLLQTVKSDCRSVTGSNLRNILLLTRKDKIDELVPVDTLEMKYVPVLDENKWKIVMLKELIDVKWGETDIENLSNDDIEAIIEDICTS